MNATLVATTYLTRRELSEMLGVSTKTIERWQREGLPAETWGRRLVRYRIDRVENWLERRAS